jgi:hypothetical protein
MIAVGKPTQVTALLFVVIGVQDVARGSAATLEKIASKTPLSLLQQPEIAFALSLSFIERFWLKIASGRDIPSLATIRERMGWRQLTGRAGTSPADEQYGSYPTQGTEAI